MLNLATKLFVAATGIALIGAIGYAAVVGDRAGADLFVVVAGVAAVLAVITAVTLTTDSPPRVVADAPAPERRTAYTEDDAPTASAWPLVTAVALVALAIALVAGAEWLATALLAGLIPALGWLGHVWREHPSFSTRVRERVVERLIAPLAMPILCTLGALFIAVMVSRVLLAVSTTASWVTALVIAAGLVVALWVISARPGLTSPALVGLAVLAAASMTVAGTFGAQAGEREFHPHEPDHPTATVIARGTQFEEKELEFPANTEVVIKFRNFDKDVFHNVAFYTSTEDDREPLWAGRPITEGRETYLTETPGPGTYAFVCDFHPTMTGKLVVTEGEADHSQHGEEGH